jgi:hypothetical protein
MHTQCHFHEFPDLNLIINYENFFHPFWLLLLSTPQGTIKIINPMCQTHLHSYQINKCLATRNYVTTEFHDRHE